MKEESAVPEGRFEKYPDILISLTGMDKVDLADYTERDFAYARKVCREHLGDGNATNAAKASALLSEFREHLQLQAMHATIEISRNAQESNTSTQELNVSLQKRIFWVTFFTAMGTFFAAAGTIWQASISSQQLQINEKQAQIAERQALLAKQQADTIEMLQRNQKPNQIPNLQFPAIQQGPEDR